LGRLVGADGGRGEQAGDERLRVGVVALEQGAEDGLAGQSLPAVRDVLLADEADRREGAIAQGQGVKPLLRVAGWQAVEECIPDVH